MRRDQVMAVTRTQSRGKKITFLEDGTSQKEPAIETSDIEQSQEEQGSDYEDSDSEDEAPEEVSTKTSAKSILEQQKEQKRIEAELKRVEREKRRQLDQQNKEQQEAKKAKKAQELPDVLPDDIIQAAQQSLEVKIQSKHLKADDFDVELKKQLKLEKLKQLKLMNRVIQKGPVHVQVLDGIKKTVPKAERKVVGSRDKWLKRKSLHKK